MAGTRTCVACRQDGPRSDFIRLVLGPDGRLWVDLKGRLPGRGAWLHPRHDCVERVVSRPRILNSALRERVDTADLASRLRERIDEALLDGLSQAAAAGALVSGREQLERSIRLGRPTELIFAKDIAERTSRQLREVAGEVPCTIIGLDRTELGARIGKGPRAAVGVLRSRACAHLSRQLQSVRDLG